MKYLLAVFLLFNFSAAFATVDPSNVEGMLDQMVADKVISPEEAEKAKIKMRNMNPAQWSALTKKAEAQLQQGASRGPASVGSSDLHGAQLDQIESDMKAMLPRMHN